MAVVANRRSVMTLFSGATDIYSHRVRVVLAEKGINVEIVDVVPDAIPEDLFELNPYGSVPTLVDRDLALYGDPIIMEYLDERFPHPPLMPVDPVSRAYNRLLQYRLDRDFYSHYPAALGKDKAATKARKALRDALLAASPVFDQKPFFLSEEFSLADCVLAPLLWRLPLLGVELPEKQAGPLLDYAARIFAREGFRKSLTDPEREMRA